MSGSWLVIVTAALAMAAPLESVSVPTIRPLTPWATAIIPPNVIRATSNPTQCSLDTPPPLPAVGYTRNTESVIVASLPHFISLLLPALSSGYVQRQCPAISTSPGNRRWNSSNSQRAQPYPNKQARTSYPEDTDS